MKKILIVGSGGAGKSTLSRKLGAKLSIPVIHLDMHFWKPGWVEVERNEWRSTVSAMCEKETWIMDGNFGETADIRYKAADTIIFLDVSRVVCVAQLLKRYLKFRKGGRPDMTEGCSEKLDFTFLRWIWNFPKNSRPKLLSRIDQFGQNTNIIILKNSRDVEKFLIKDLYDTSANTRRSSALF